MLEFTTTKKGLLTRVFLICLGIEAFIVFADIFLNALEWIPYRPLRRSFNITREDAIGNWFSSTQWLMIAAVLVLLYIHERKRGWLFIAGFFAFLAIDDATLLHERVGSSFKGIASSEFVSAFPTYMWQVTIGPFFVLFGIYIAWFLYREVNEKNQILLFFSALACLAIAVAMDFVEGMDLEGMTSYPWKHGQKLVEEFLEMLGGTLFLVGFLDVLVSRAKSLRVEIS